MCMSVFMCVCMYVSNYVLMYVYWPTFMSTTLFQFDKTTRSGICISIQ